MSSGIVVIPATTFRVSTPIVLKRNVIVDATGATIQCAVSPCITQDTNINVQNTGWKGGKFVPYSSAYIGITVFNLTSFQRSRFEKFDINGFNTGTWLVLGGAVPSKITWEDTWGAGNVYFTNFHDINVDGCNICTIISGHYPTGSGPDAPSPDQVVTPNNFYAVNMFNVARSAWNFVRAADTNNVFGSFVELNAAGAVYA